MSLSRVQHRRLWRAVSAMFSLNGALFGIWASRIPAVAERHALSPGDLGLLLLLMAAGALAAFPFAGHAADQRGAYRVTCWVAFGYVGALGLIALAPGTWSLAGALVFFGATHGGMDVTMNTWAGEAERRMGRPVMSSFHAMFSLGAGLGAASGFAAVTLDASIAQHIFVAAPLFAVLAFFMARVEWQDSPAKTSGPAPMFAIPRGPLFSSGSLPFVPRSAKAQWQIGAQ